MVHLSIMLNRKPNMSVEEFQKYWREEHAPLGKKMPGVKKYSLSLTHESEYAGKTPVCDGIAEFWFESPEACAMALQSPEGQLALKDLANFVDESKTRSLLSRDELII